jgi:hypothetical protein
MTGIAPVREPDFNADASFGGTSGGERPTTLMVVLTGNADLNVKTMLDHFLVAVHEESQRRHIPEVEVDVRKLEFMNSSCLKCLVGWISRIQDSPPAAQYRVAFRSSPTMFWQRRSLQALSYLATDLVSVST